MKPEVLIFLLIFEFNNQKIENSWGFVVSSFGPVPVESPVE